VGCEDGGAKAIAVELIVFDVVVMVVSAEDVAQLCFALLEEGG